MKKLLLIYFLTMKFNMKFILPNEKVFLDINKRIKNKKLFYNLGYCIYSDIVFNVSNYFSKSYYNK